MCTCIYFVDIGSFDGKEMPPPPPDPVHVDLHEDAKAGANQSDTNYKMELADQLISLFDEAGIRPAFLEI